MRRAIYLSLLVLVLAAASENMTMALEATPVPTACDVEPIETADLEEIVAAGPGDPGSLQSTGEPISAEMLVGAFRLISESIDCANANDPLRSMALHSDRYLATRFAGPDGEDELGHLIAAASRTPVPAAPEDQLFLLGVTETDRYADGRIGVLVTTANRESVFTDLVILAETDAGWRIDEVVLDADKSSGATPAAQ